MSFMFGVQVHKKNKVRSLAKHVLPPLQLTTKASENMSV